MTKVSRKPINSKDLSGYLNNLWAAFTLMDSKESIRRLFKDLFTPSEYKMFAKRLEIARRLAEGETYEQIQKAVNVGSPTITQVHVKLESDNGGLRQALEALKQQMKTKQKMELDRIERIQNPIRKHLLRKSVLAATVEAGASSLRKYYIRKNRTKSASRFLGT